MTLSVLDSFHAFVKYYLLVLRRPRVSNVFKRQLEETMSTTESVIQRCSVLRRRGRVRGVIDKGAKIIARRQAWRRRSRGGIVSVIDLIHSKLRKAFEILFLQEAKTI